MSKWSPTTLLRELEDYQEEEGWEDDAKLSEVKESLGNRIIVDTLAKSREKREKQGESPLPMEAGDRVIEETLAKVKKK